jgi:ribosomal protein S12 methylthiotransferase
VREERRARFMAVAEQVSAAKLQRRVGQTMQVLVDRRRRWAARAGGRTYADAPEIDGTCDPAAREGQQDDEGGRVRRVRIVAADGHDLVGSLV